MDDGIEKQSHVPAALPQSSPTCPRCGFEVSRKGQLCSTCAEREDARPKPMFDLGEHKAPPERENPNSVEAISPPAGR